MPADTNPAGDIFGGGLMVHMGLAAGSVATRTACGRAARVAVEAMTFHSPALVGNEVSLYGGVLETGRTSIRIRIEAGRRRREDETALKVTEATFTLFAIGDDRRPRRLDDLP